jgi:hypothetical protein
LLAATSNCNSLQLQLVLGMFTVLLLPCAAAAAASLSHFRSARSSSQRSLLLQDGAADRFSGAVL